MKNFMRNFLKSVKTLTVLTAGMAVGGLIETEINPVMISIIALSIGINALASFMLREIEIEEIEEV